MTSQAQADPSAGPGTAAPASAPAGRSTGSATSAGTPGDRRPAGRRGERAQAVVTALLLLVLLAGDLLVALRLPVQQSTCADRLCGPALPVAAGAVGAGVVAVVTWLLADRRRERGRGVAWCWVALLPAALPWVFVTLRLQWW